ncbi:hypothetical protein IG631_00130 [Alternaria alternata]|nr:hypothetical protein IG631_00130 [Alternaria alternata]
MAATPKYDSSVISWTSVPRLARGPLNPSMVPQLWDCTAQQPLTSTMVLAVMATKPLSQQSKD